MKQLSYWNKFAKSGNVLDYLYYKQAENKKESFYFNRKQKKRIRNVGVVLATEEIRGIVLKEMPKRRNK